MAKLEILTNYWHKLQGRIQNQASRIGDSEMTELMKKVINVKKKIKIEALEFYIK